MQKLHLDTLMVESFTTTEAGFGLDGGDPIALQPGVSDGVECTRTLYVSCSCKCQTVEYNCA